MRTTFVVGAGASKDLSGSFPVGSELAQQIEDALSRELQPNEDGPISVGLMRGPRGMSADHREAMIRIRNSILSEDSIDDFLSAWSEVPHIDHVAKLAIAHLILDAERRCALYVENVSDAGRTTRLRQFNTTWLGRIMRRPDKGRRDIEAILEGISFIVFNYDRVVEQYISLYARYVLDRPEAEADEIVDNLSIVHAYGSLGSVTNRQNVRFGADELYLNMAAANLRTYNEDHPSADVARIRKIVSESDKLVFLGCAFHEQNLDLLFGDEESESKSGKVFLGTCQGVPQRKLAAVQERLSRVGGSSSFNASLGCSDYVAVADDAIFY